MANIERAVLIVNPAAGRGSPAVERAREALAQRFELQVLETCEERDADVCAREALRGKPSVIVVAGGDGTVSLAAEALVGSETALGILPLGTANSIAAALGIPADDAGAVETILQGEARRFDSARANGRGMLLHASVGFHASTVAGAPREDKQRWGVLAYLKEGLSNLSELEEFQVEIETESEVVRCRAINVMVANAASAKTVFAQGPAEVVPDDGKLDVTIVAATGLADAVAAGLHLLQAGVRQQPASSDNVGFLRARRLRIDSDPAQPLLIDGEPAGEGRLSVECRPQSVRILVPAGSLSPAAPASGEAPKLEGLPELEVAPKRK